MSCAINNIVSRFLKKFFPKKIFLIFFLASGEVLTCGDNTYGQLGYRNEAPSLSPDSHHPEILPEVVTALEGLEVTKIACGDFFSIAACKGERNIIILCR